MAAVAAVDLVKVYGSGDTAVRALDGVTVGFARAQFTAIMGPSGSGKSTLMHCLAGLDTATSGQALLGGTDLTRQSDKVLTKVRRERIGFVFQAFNLLPQLTAAQNILLPLELSGRRPDPHLYGHLTESLGITGRLDHRPGELSGGQQQRVAIVRALAVHPRVLLLDEITSALDPELVGEVLQVMKDLAQEGWTMVVVTHEIRFAQQVADQVLFIHEGVVLESGPPSQVLAEPREARTRQFLHRILDPI